MATQLRANPKWMSATTCDFCGRDAREVGPFFYDAPTVQGPWALMCGDCASKYAVPGGQKYDSKTLEKVTGKIAIKEDVGGSTKLSYEEWLRKVNRIVGSKLGLGIEDLPDNNYRQWHEQGMSPQEAARTVIEDVSDEYGFDFNPPKSTTCANCGAEMPTRMDRYCGAYVCEVCGHHEGLARCYCGWSASDVRGGGREELEDMGEVIDPEDDDLDLNPPKKLSAKEVAKLRSKVIDIIRSRDYSPRMGALVAFLANVAGVTKPQITAISITSDGFLMYATDVDPFFNGMLGTLPEAENNLGLLREHGDVSVRELAYLVDKLRGFRSFPPHRPGYNPPKRQAYKAWMAALERAVKADPDLKKAYKLRTLADVRAFLEFAAETLDLNYRKIWREGQTPNMIASYISNAFTAEEEESEEDFHQWLAEFERLAREQFDVNIHNYLSAEVLKEAWDSDVPVEGALAALANMFPPKPSREEDGNGNGRKPKGDLSSFEPVEPRSQEFIDELVRKSGGFKARAFVPFGLPWRQRAQPSDPEIINVEKLKNIVMTRGVVAALEDAGLDQAYLFRFLARFGRGDWGECDREDWEQNTRSVRSGDMILGAYKLRDGTSFWLILDAGHETLTALLPEEY